MFTIRVVVIESIQAIEAGVITYSKTCADVGKVMTTVTLVSVDHGTWLDKPQGCLVMVVFSGKRYEQIHLSGYPIEIRIRIDFNPCRTITGEHILSIGLDMIGGFIDDILFRSVV